MASTDIVHHCKLLSLPAELHFQIYLELEPHDLLQLKGVCSSLRELISERHVWEYALKKMCIDNHIFEPTYDATAMSVLELQRASLTPWRWNSRVTDRAKSSGTLEWRTAAVLQAYKPDPEAPCDIEGLRIIPGGRYLIARSRSLVSFWDVGNAPGRRAAQGKMPEMTDSVACSWNSIVQVSQAMLRGECIRFAVMEKFRERVSVRAFEVGPLPSQRKIRLLSQLYLHDIDPSADSDPSEIPAFAMHSEQNLIICTISERVGLWDYAESRFRLCSVVLRDGDHFRDNCMVGDSVVHITEAGVYAWKIPHLSRLEGHKSASLGLSSADYSPSLSFWSDAELHKPSLHDPGYRYRRIITTANCPRFGLPLTSFTLSIVKPDMQVMGRVEWEGYVIELKDLATTGPRVELVARCLYDRPRGYAASESFGLGWHVFKPVAGDSERGSVGAICFENVTGLAQLLYSPLNSGIGDRIPAYECAYPHTYLPEEVSKVPLARTARKGITAPLYGLGVVLPSRWCRAKVAKFLREETPDGKVYLWLNEFLVERAKELGMDIPTTVPQIYERSLGSCLVCYRTNYHKPKEMQNYTEEQAKMDIENLCKLLDANKEEGKALLQNWKWHRSPCHPDVETDRAVVHVVEQSSEYDLADDGAACRNYDRLYPLTFELDETSRVPIARTAPRNAPWRAPVYGIGLVLRGDWCRYIATQFGASAPHLPMGVWFGVILTHRAEDIGMKAPFRLPHVCDRNLRTCLLTYQVNLKREGMAEYAATQQEEDFETMCALLDLTPEEKEIFKGNWKWHRQPCNELVETDTPEPPIPRVFHPPEPL